MAKNKTTFNISKKENFSDWYSDILNAAEITDIRYGVKGFIVIRPWGARIMENMYKIYEQALQEQGHQPTFFPIVIPEQNFTKEASHVEGFTPEVFWLENKQGEERLALRPTSETAMYQMYALWIRSHRDLPLKLYQRGSVYRYETKATRPLIRGREFFWIEAHDCFATKKEAEHQVQQDITMTENVMHQTFGIPFLPMKRPIWDTFPGAEYTVGSDSIMPDGKIIQQPSTHLLGQHFSKPFNVKFADEKEQEQYVWQTCYGPAISRIMASVIAMHGDDKGLRLPFILSPIQVVIVPIYKAGEGKKLVEQAELLQQELKAEGISSYIDTSDKRPGEKFYHWEMKGIPLRIELGEQELTKEEVTLSIRDSTEKQKLSMKHLSKELIKQGIAYDKRLLTQADNSFNNSIKTCKTKEEVTKALQEGMIARFPYCTTDKEGKTCAETIEKTLTARVMGTRADKEEKATGNCAFCNKKATAMVYAGKSY